MPLEGQHLGHYRLLRLLGSGGMGEVYLAEDARIGQQVAIKVIRSDGIAYPGSESAKEAARLFEREARAIARLDHPNILPLYAYGEETLGEQLLTYLVMPYRKEGTLANWLRQRGSAEPLSPAQVAPLLQQAAGALQHAHRQQVIHQDIKSTNFLIRLREDQPDQFDVLLSDFGIAKFTSATASSSQSIRGTPIYMAPEQWDGHPVAATDQYALAIMVYELLVGRPPFVGNPGQVMRQHYMTPPPALSSLNPRLSPATDAVLLRALAKQPEERFASVMAFAQAFGEAAQSSGELKATLAISLAEAQTGTTRTLTLPGGRRVSVSVPAGMRDGSVLRLEGQGMPYYEGGPTGALVLIMHIAADNPPLPSQTSTTPTLAVSPPMGWSPFAQGVRSSATASDFLEAMKPAMPVSNESGLVPTIPAEQASLPQAEVVTPASRILPPAQVARSSIPSPVARQLATGAARPPKSNTTRLLVLICLAGLIFGALASGIVWFTAHQASPTGGIPASPAGRITEFPIPITSGGPSSSPVEITAGPDGNLWFTERDGNKIGRISPGGTVTEFPVPTANSYLDGITAGPDGNLWFTELNGIKIGRITSSGTITEFPLPTANSYLGGGITAGPDRNLWFTESSGIGRITPGGIITEFPVPTTQSDPGGITKGPDGNLWFTEFNGNKIGRISPSGAITEFLVSTTDSAPDKITAGPDGNLWFTEARSNKIGRISLSGVVTEFPLPTANSYLDGITAGPDGNLWFTEGSVSEGSGNKIGRITPGGTITEFPVPTASSYLYGITAGPDGNLWFTEFDGNKIGHITPSGAITEFPVPITQSYPSGITAGPDGNLWFTEYIGIGRITPSGTITEFPVPTSKGLPGEITAGPDGNLWFTEVLSNKIGRITPGGKVTEFPVPTSPPGGSLPGGITAGPDGNLWFTEARGNNIGRISPSGAITEFPVPTTNSNPGGITAGPDGNLWFTEIYGNKIGRISPSGAITEFPIPTADSNVGGEITAGPDGNLWFTEARGIGRITPRGAITEFPVPIGPGGITAGPDGNLWFTEARGIGRITPRGVITEFPVPTTGSGPSGITAGPDGNLWFTEYDGNKIGRITSGK